MPLIQSRQLFLMLLLIIAATAGSTSLFCKKWLHSCEMFDTHCSNSTNSTDTNNTNPDIPSPPNADKVLKSCCELNTTAKSGVYKIHRGPFSTETTAYCEVDKAGGRGWTVVLRRIKGALPFNRSWTEYEFGFGTLSGEFWYGLDKMNFLTSRGDWEMQVDMTTNKKTVLTASYSKFQVHGPDSQYSLSIGGHNGNGEPDFMRHQSQSNFTTYDRNNNLRSGGHCAIGPYSENSGWWYSRSCLGDKGLNLNGPFRNGVLKWVINSYENHKITEIVMKIRQLRTPV